MWLSSLASCRAPTPGRRPPPGPHGAASPHLASQELKVRVRVGGPEGFQASRLFLALRARNHLCTLFTQFPVPFMDGGNVVTPLKKHLPVS